jgi:Tfp pilus assembly protein PilF
LLQGIPIKPSKKRLSGKLKKFSNIIMKSFTKILAVCFCLFLISCGFSDHLKNRHIKRGESFFVKGNYAKAREEFKYALQIDPQFSKAFYLLGQVALK